MYTYIHMFHKYTCIETCMCIYIYTRKKKPSDTFTKTHFDLYTYSTVQYNTIQFSTVQYNTIQRDFLNNKTKNHTT